MGFPVEATRRTIGILGQTLPDNATADATGIVALRNAAPALLRLAAAAVAWGKAEPFVHERGGMERLVKAEVALRAALADPLLHESQP